MLVWEAYNHADEEHCRLGSLLLSTAVRYKFRLTSSQAGLVTCLESSKAVACCNMITATGAKHLLCTTCIGGRLAAFTAEL